MSSSEGDFYDQNSSEEGDSNYYNYNHNNNNNNNNNNNSQTSSTMEDAWLCQNCTEFPNYHHLCSNCGRARHFAENVNRAIDSIMSEQSELKRGELLPNDPTQKRTGYVYEEQCERHEDPDTNSHKIHPERPGRTKAIHARLNAQGLINRCERVPSRQAEEHELCKIHPYEHVKRVQHWSSENNSGLYEGDKPESSDVYVNQSSALSAALSAGCVISITEKVAKGELSNGIANVRPPGHHAEESEAMGFCFYNNVAVAAKMAQEINGIHKILIVDWDIHHGNATENQFLNDPNVMYISLHRYEHGNFYPGSGNPRVVGTGRGAGHNINIAWPHGGVGDIEYLAAFYHVIMPIATMFAPDLVLISAGFDSADGDPLGGCSVSPAGFAHMTGMLKSLARGRLVLCLEGGYNMRSIAHSMEACARVLLGDAPMPPIVEKPPSTHVMKAIFETFQYHQPYWSILGHLGMQTQPSNRMQNMWGGSMRYNGVGIGNTGGFIGPSGNSYNPKALENGNGGNHDDDDNNNNNSDKKKKRKAYKKVKTKKKRLKIVSRWMKMKKKG